MDIRSLALQTAPYVIEQRRAFHAHPELSWKEFRTTEAIAAELEKDGLEVRRFSGHTGCAAEIRGGRGGAGRPTVLLRADIDALPIAEKTGLPFASENPGVMHACGHDCHIAMLLGAAKILCGLRESLPGNVRLLFQAAEEIHGSEVFVADGILDGAGAVFGQHIWAGLAAPLYDVSPGPRMASCDEFFVTVEGVSSHGSAPNLGRDAVVAASAIILSLQTVVSRVCDPLDPLVVTVGTVHGGQRWNICPGRVEMTGTCRTHSRAMRDKTERELARICTETAAALGTKAVFRYQRDHGPVINDCGDLNRIARGAAVKLFGEEGVGSLPLCMASEDFANYMEKVPGVFGFLGSFDPARGYGFTNHSDRYTVGEDTLWRGTAMLAQFAADFLFDR